MLPARPGDRLWPSFHLSKGGGIVLIDFDFDKAQAKIIAATSGPAIIQIGPGLYLERFELDPSFPAFLNCAKLESLAG